ncbi:pyrroline-5-carboxylate reductase [Mesorhizobium sp. Z1-4]|uniref:pyrroline-5-carboxylate reductase n=1 Tax=Mesorhizobium sp. Z1-4 TaxID=2448478 RepID=UPI000FD7EE72|nr:pyrroline-5-carboxylate reductase [Mesorhizobium sp. Z1-4]
MAEKRVILVGCGNMGRAMLEGWLDAGRLKPGQVDVVEPTDALREHATALGVNVHASAEGLALAGDAIVILAVKPQVIVKVAEGYRGFAQTGATFVSIAAGTPVSALEGALGAGTAIIRCMPNTPAAIGKGMMVVYANSHVASSTLDEVKLLLSASGMVETIDDEELMHAVTAVSGSGPAYLFHFIECLTAAGEKAGLPAETAAQLAMQTAYGAASLAAASDDPPSRLREQVTSPNGTTAAALGVLMGPMGTLMDEAVEAARKRSEELGR